jgi:hypothetical protein
LIVNFKTCDGELNVRKSESRALGAIEFKQI